MDVQQQTINGNLTKIDKEPCKVINSTDTPEHWKKVHWKFKQKKSYTSRWTGQDTGIKNF